MSKTREVLFFGSITTTVLCATARSDAVQAQLRQMDGRLRLRASVRAPHARVEETLGMAPTSAPFKVEGKATVPTDKAARYMNLPVLLELAQDAAADPPKMWEMDPEYEEGVEEVEGSQYACVSATVTLSVELARGAKESRQVGVKSINVRSLRLQSQMDMCTVVRVDVSNTFLQKMASAKTVYEDVPDSDTGMSVYVLVRVVDLSQKAATTLEADELYRSTLNRSQPTPRFSMRFTRKLAVPYGCMTMGALYEHYRLFFSRCYGKKLTHEKEIAQLLHTMGGPEAEESYPIRWNVYRTVNLQRVLLGEDAITPLLAALAHAPNVVSFLADNNGLSDLTCTRMCALFSQHRTLSTISLNNNRVHEVGADHLLRLVRRNRRITSLQLKGVYCSEEMLERINTVTAANVRNILSDPLNLLAPQYASVTAPSSLQAATTKLALGVWAMLSAAPMGDVDVWVRNSTTKMLVEQYQDNSAAPRLKAAMEAHTTPPSIVPAVARAPLLSEVMRTVYVGISRVVPDPLVRTVFADIDEAARIREKRAELCQSDALGDEHKELPADLLRVLTTNGDKFTAPPDDEGLYATSFLRIVVTVARCIALNADWDKTSAELREIGRLQKHLGVTWEDYWLASHVFAKSLYVCCGSEELAPERVSAFMSILVLGIRTAVGGVDERTV